MRAFPGNSGVMAAGNVVSAEFLRFFQKIIKLNPPVAHNAGVRCPAGKVGLTKIVNDFFLEYLTAVQNIMGDIKNSGNSFGVFNGGKTAATSNLFGGGPQLEGKTNDFMACF